MSALQLEGLVGHEWEVDRCLYRGLARGVVNVVGHLRQVSRAKDPLEWFPFSSLAPCLALPRLTLDLVPQGSSWCGWFLKVT